MAFSRSKIMMSASGAFIAGLALASFLPGRWLGHDLWWFSGAIGGALAAVLFYKKNNQRNLIGLFFLWLSLFSFGLWRYAVSLPADSPDKIWYYNGRELTVEGLIAGEPDIRQTSQKLEIAAVELKLPDLSGWQRVSGKLLLTTGLYPSYDYGQELVFSCRIETPERFNDFAYDRYLARYNIYSVCYYPDQVSSQGRAGGLKYHFYRQLFAFKDKLRQQINYGLAEPRASLARAIVLGDKKGLPDELQASFSQAGISHIMAISGMHISILAALLMGLLLALGLSRRRSFWLATIFLLVYIILIGLPASAMRAGLMGFLVLWAMNLGRLNKITNSLVLAAAVLVFINPRLLRDDIGFQLSLLAVLGIVYVYPIFNYWSGRLAGVRQPVPIKAALTVINISLAAQLLTWPIIAYNFSQLSLVAPLTNLLILWSLPFLMVALIGALALSLIAPIWPQIFFLPAGLFTGYIIMTARQITRLPLAYLTVGDWRWGWLAAYYLFLIWLYFKIFNHSKNKTV